MMNKILIPNALRHHRKLAGLRLVDVALKLGFSEYGVDRISKWERGLAMPGVINLLKLAEIYQVRPEEFYPRNLLAKMTSQIYSIDDKRYCSSNKIDSVIF